MASTLEKNFERSSVKTLGRRSLLGKSKGRQVHVSGVSSSNGDGSRVVNSHGSDSSNLRGSLPAIGETGNTIELGTSEKLDVIIEESKAGLSRAGSTDNVSN